MKHDSLIERAGRGCWVMAACVALAVTSAAFAQMPASSPGKAASKDPATPASQAQPMGQKDSAAKTAASGDMHASMMTMMKDMESMKVTGDTDVDFATMMKVHHQGAIDMAQMELQSGKNAKMRAMAKRIIDAQQKEIKEFDKWLGKHE